MSDQWDKVGELSKAADRKLLEILDLEMRSAALRAEYQEIISKWRDAIELATKKETP